MRVRRRSIGWGERRLHTSRWRRGHGVTIDADWPCPICGPSLNSEPEWAGDRDGLRSCETVRVQPAKSRSVSARTGLGIAIGLVSALAFSASGPFVHPLFAIGWTPGAAVFWRMTCAAFVMLPLALWSMRGHWADLRSEWGAIVAFGIAAVATPQFMYFAAVSRMSVSIALLIEYMSPVLLVAIAWGRSRHAPARSVLAGTFVSIAGLLCVLDLAGAAPDPLGVLCAFGSMFGAASYFFLSARPTKLAPAALAGFGLVVGALTLGAGIALGLLPYRAPLVPTTLGELAVPWWVPLAILAVIATAVAYGLGIVSVSLMGERLASFVGLSEVLFAAALAAILLGEIPTPIQLVGAALIVGGVVLVKLGAAPATRPDPAGSLADDHVRTEVAADTQAVLE